MQSILFSALVLPSALAMAGSATTLFVASYAGNVTSLSVSASNGQYSLKQLSSTNGCAPNPSWLTLDYQSKALYCLDEGLNTVNGSLTSFDINDDGSLTTVSHKQTINGPVSGAIYGSHGTKTGKKAMALAHYVGSAVSSWGLSKDSTPSFTHMQDITFKLTKPGTVPDRQDAPHEHEIIVDPTGQYLLVPDLGADVVRVFNYDNDAKLKSLSTLPTAPGYGPRHGVFYNPSGKAGESEKTFFYVIGEISNKITGYSVKYLPNNGGLAFTQVFESTAFGNLPVPHGNAVAEIALSPDNRFIVISNRDTDDAEPPKQDSKANADTKSQSDSLSTFAVNKDGSLTFQDVVPCGGLYPRHFSMNKEGDLVAVGLQYGSAVVLLERDVKSGKIGKTVAKFPIEGQVTCVRWNEPVFDGSTPNFA